MTTREAFRKIRRAMWEREMRYDKDHRPIDYRAADIDTVANWITRVGTPKLEWPLYKLISLRELNAVADAWERLTLRDELWRGRRMLTEEQQKQILA